MPRALYKVIGEYPIEERDPDGYTTGRDAQPGETVELDDDEHTLDINGQRLKIRINVQALLQAGLIEPAEAPTKADAPASKATDPKVDAKPKDG